MFKAFQRVRSMRLCKPGRTLRVRLDMGGTGISKSEVSRLCADIDTKVNAFLQRPVEGNWPYVWIDATWLKMRENHRIVSVAVIIAVAVNTGGRREVIGMATGPSEAETFWTDFLRSLLRRGLRGVKLVIPDAHTGIRAAVSKVTDATWQRCRVQFASRRLRRHAQCACPCQGRPAHMVAAMQRTIFSQDSARDIREQWDKVTDSLRARHPKLGQLMDGAKEDVLAFTGFPKEHWTKIYLTNPPGGPMARSSAGPTWSASFQTTNPSSVWRARCCPDKTTNGPSRTAT